MKILVIGGTGTVGSQVVNELMQRDVEDVQVLTRSAEKAKALPKDVQGVVGGLLEPETVRTVFEGIDRVFLLLPVSLTEAHQGLMALHGIRKAGVKRLVYMSVQDVDERPHIPHFGSKLSIERAIKSSGISYTILRPNAFYQNDYLFKEPLLQNGVYPDPLGDVGLSRVDVRDIAEATAITLTTEDHHNETYNIVGPDVLTGEKTAEVWSKVLNKPIAYGGNNLDVFEQQLIQQQSPQIAFDFKLMMASFQNYGLKAAPSDIERQTELLGHAPRDYKDFVSETAKTWQSSTKESLANS